MCIVVGAVLHIFFVSHSVTYNVYQHAHTVSNTHSEVCFLFLVFLWCIFVLVVFGQFLNQNWPRKPCYCKETAIYHVILPAPSNHSIVVYASEYVAVNSIYLNLNMTVELSHK